MPISVYTGVVGSGKSYEAIKNGLLPAIRSGRRVVTNISGVNEQKIHDYLIEKFNCDPASLGRIVVVENEIVMQPGFFPGEAKSDFKFDIPQWVPLRELHHYAGEFVISTGKSFTRTAFQLLLPELRKLKELNIDLGSCLIEAAHREWKGFEFGWFLDKPRGEVFAELPVSGPSVVQPGDFVIIDEAWRYWSDSEKITAEHMNFFRMHRHYVGADGVACDMLVLIQDFGSLNRFLRGVCELVLIFHKLKSIGAHSKYRVEVYEGKPRRQTLVSTSPIQKYDKKIFPLYKSYDGVGGKELRTDDRQSLLKNKWFLISMLAALVLVGYFAPSFYNMVARMRKGGADEVVNQNGPANSTAGSAVPNSNQSALELKKNISPDVHLVGIVELNTGEAIALFQTEDGRFVHQKMNAGLIDGWQSVAGYNGKMVGFSFGVKAK